MQPYTPGVGLSGIITLAGDKNHVHFIYFNWRYPASKAINNITNFKIMRKLIYAMMVSLDGFIEDKNGNTEWAIVDDELHRHFNEEDASKGAYLFGRRLFEDMCTYWPTADDDPEAPDYVREFAGIWRKKPKYVFSKTLKKADYNSVVISENVVEEIKKLKQEPGDDLSLSGATLADICIRHGLVDEYLIYLNPVVLGGGRPMFPADVELSLILAESQSFDCGVVRLSYLTDTSS
jgi:dihydrofolate reductase